MTINMSSMAAQLITDKLKDQLIMLTYSVPAPVCSTHLFEVGADGQSRCWIKHSILETSYTADFTAGTLEPPEEGLKVVIYVFPDEIYVLMESEAK